MVVGSADCFSVTVTCTLGQVKIKIGWPSTFRSQGATFSIQNIGFGVRAIDRHPISVIAKGYIIMMPDRHSKRSTFHEITKPINADLGARRVEYIPCVHFPRFWGLKKLESLIISYLSRNSRHNYPYTRNPVQFLELTMTWIGPNWWCAKIFLYSWPRMALRCLEKCCSKSTGACSLQSGFCDFPLVLLKNRIYRLKSPPLQKMVEIEKLRLETAYPHMFWIFYLICLRRMEMI